MANAAEIVRIMRHAAERLEQESADDILPRIPGARHEEERQRALSIDIAMTYAASVLRMVAAVMDDAPDEGGAADA